MSLPSIDPEDLRVHADPARIERIWSRLEADLPEATGAAPRRLGSRRAGAAVLLAASLAAFGGGVLVGHNAPEQPSAVPPMATATDEAVDVVLAAGTRSRTFSLPGGGVVTLLPGGTMEIGAVDGGVVSLRLVQGEASVETAGGGTVAIEAGQARVSTIGASSLSIRRDERAIDVAVTDGLVEVEGPDGRKTLRTGQRTTASTVLTTAVLDAPQVRRETKVPSSLEAPLMLDDHGAPPPQPAPLETDAPASAPGWFALYEAGKFDEAAGQLPSGEMTAAIERGRTARELMALDHLARSKGEKVLAMRALTRVATEFPDDPLAKIAAMTLGNLHRSAGNHLLAAQYDELAKNSQFAEDVACRKLGELAVTDPGAADVARAYLAKFPEGRCRGAAEDLLSDAEHDANAAREDAETTDAEDPAKAAPPAGDGQAPAAQAPAAQAPAAPGAPAPAPPPPPVAPR